MILFWVLFLVFQFANALKHSFTTVDDRRTIIGPLGFPFGFLDTGHYEMKVFDYNLYSEDQPSVENHVAGVGFLLKRFKDESEFNHYINEIQQNDTMCVFQRYLNQGEDPFKDGDDSFSNDGDGQVISAVEDGIFLDMSKTDRWAPNSAHVSYDFRRGEAGYYFLIYQICSPPKVRTLCHLC